MVQSMNKKIILLMLLSSMIIINAYTQREGDWNTLNPPNAPDARQGHSMVTLPDGRVMLFGGEGPQADLFNDLYAYDNNNWGEITPSNEPPSPRRDHEAWIYGDQLYIWGGKGQNGSLGDMWSYDIISNEWTERTMSGSVPPARYGHSTTITNNGTTYILGGKSAEGTCLRDFYRINPDLSCVRLSDAAGWYFNHITHLIDEDLLLVFGKTGFIGLYQISAGMWGETPGGFPLQEYNGSVYSGNTLFALGGKDEYGNIDNTVYRFNTVTGEVTTMTDPLPAMIENGGGAKYYGNTDNDDQYHILLFGGIVDGEVSNNTYMSTGNLLDIDEIDFEKYFNVNISPNPAEDLLSISANNEIDLIQIFSINGKLIKELKANKPEVMLDVLFYENGLYIINLSIGQYTACRKILKQ